jgi:hypothetical protein
MSVLCPIIGCRLDDNYICDRCGLHLYDGGYDRPCPTIRAIQSAFWHVANFVPGKKCEVCGKRFWRRDRYYTCSAKCADEWIPF